MVLGGGISAPGGGRLGRSKAAVSSCLATSLGYQPISLPDNAGKDNVDGEAAPAAYQLDKYSRAPDSESTA